MNPILEQMRPTQSPVQQMWAAYRNAQNPQQYLNSVVQQNPILGQLVGNGNPKDTFYALCKQKGVDPDSILSQLK